jgi:hypothetical protein
LTGIYIGLYLIPLLNRSIKRRNAYRKLLTFVQLCSKDDRTVTALLVASRENNETYTLTKELADSIYRINNRSSNSIDYIDEINMKQIGVQVIGINNVPLSNVHIEGILPIANTKISGITNANGFTVLFWDGPDDIISEIQLNNTTTKEGPFMMNGQYVISYIDPLRISA